MTQNNSNVVSWQTGLLSPNNFQLLLIALLSVVAIVFIFNKSATQEKAELFDGYRPTPAELNQILIAFGKSDLDGYEIVSGQVWVPQTEKANFLSAVQENGATPTSLEKQKETSANPFLPKSQQLALRLNKKKRQVRDMITRLSFVREAWFEFDEFEPNSVFQDSQHSAVVMVTLNEAHALTKQHVATIQGLVSGAFAKISAKNIVVTDANMGIAYQDLGDRTQVELIELVNWKMQRKIQHLEKLSALLDEFPGLQIEVDVKKPDYSKIPKVATSKNARSHSVNFAKYDRELTLNGSGEVLIDTIVQNRNSSTNTSTSATTTETPKKHLSPPTAEIVDIHLRVPANFAEIELLSEDEMTQQEKMALLKAKLATRVHQSLPELSSNNALNVSVTIIPDTEKTKTQNAIVEHLQNYWPLFAILLIGLVNIAITRKSPEKSVSTSTESTFDETTKASNPQELEQQLTELIDNDPEAAAKVIKKWIRDAS